MLSIICFLAISSLAVLSLTRYRILVICGLYSFYALLPVLDEGHVPRIGPLTIYRALYLILVIAVVALVIQDSNFLLRMRRWPVFSYIALLILVLGSALYSQTNSALDFDDSAGVWNRVVVLGLFWMSAALVQEESDVKFFGITSAGVALVLSLWVIWSASQFDFEALRGGVAVNQNHISVFVLAGAIPLVNCLFSARSYFFRVIVMLSLLLMML